MYNLSYGSSELAHMLEQIGIRISAHRARHSQLPLGAKQWHQVSGFIPLPTLAYVG
jgi:hypothetical protein